MARSSTPNRGNGNSLINLEAGLVLNIGDCFIYLDKQGRIIYGTSYQPGWCSATQTTPFDVERKVIPFGESTSLYMRAKRLAKILWNNQYGIAHTAPHVHNAYNYMFNRLNAQGNSNPTPLEEIELIFHFYANWIQNRQKRPHRAAR